MVVCLVEELDLSPFVAGIDEPLQGLDNLGLVAFRLFKKDPGHTHGDLEFWIRLEELGKKIGGGEIALLGNLDKDLPVFLLPEKLVPVRVEPERLMKLKINCEEWHDGKSPISFYGSM
jgi:hypothetical protein